MPDSSQNLDINIRTNADLSGAREAEAQLERDTAAANDLANAFRECEARLELILNTLREPALASGIAASNTPPNLGGTNASVSPAFPASNTPPNVNGSQPAATNGNPPLPNNSPNSASPAASPSTNQNNLAFPPPAPNNATNVNGVAPTAPEPTRRSLEDGSFNDEIFLNPPPRTNTNTNTNTAADTQMTNQSLQNLAEQFRNGWQQNSEFTVSLFEQMMILVSQQNQIFSGLQRQVSDLSGQLKSLKNP